MRYTSHKRPPATLSRAVRVALRLRTHRRAVCAAVAIAGLGGAPVMAASPTPFPAELWLDRLEAVNGGNGSVGFVVLGSSPEFATQLKNADGGPDFNGDGIDDLILGSPYASPGGELGAGQAYIVFGREAPFPPELDLADLLPANGGDGTDGMVLSGTYGDYYSWQATGYSVSHAGDINDDGFGDFLIGAPGRTFRDGSSGSSYLVFGSDQPFPAEVPIHLASAIGGTPPTRVSGTCTSGYSGNTVSGAGDVNGDGIDDLIAGGPGDNAYYSTSNWGTTILLFGNTTLPDRVSGCDIVDAGGDDGAVFTGIDSVGYYGDESATSIAGGGDINGDGLDDFVIGAPEAEPLPGEPGGESDVVFGRTGAPGDAFEGSELLENLMPVNGGDGSRGVIFNGFDNIRSGRIVDVVGDINADGFDDFSIMSLGSSYLVFGRESFPPVVELSAFHLPPGALAEEGFVVSGGSIYRAGDLNADGLDDALLVGEPDDSISVLYGRTTPFPAEFHAESLLLANGGDGSEGVVLRGYPDARYGGRSGPVGDINHDGIVDVFINVLPFDPDMPERNDFGYVLFGRGAPLDIDNDSVIDASDNCLHVANADHRDTDSDGIGNACDADFNNDCIVNFADLAIMKFAFFSAAPTVDLDGDGAVNFTDLALLKAGFFEAPGPSGIAGNCTAVEQAPKQIGKAPMVVVVERAQRILAIEQDLQVVVRAWTCCRAILFANQVDSRSAHELANCRPGLHLLFERRSRTRIGPRPVTRGTRARGLPGSAFDQGRAEMARLHR